ncbi:MAG: SDR family NAD(P)-dependent oxidoreductase [Rhizobium sp.]|jgi:3-oxoacyl-[acyl-carrier protein] reductase|uniref:SDR family NAD(P)-dependent oxidoreductase n=1 Tax=Rhizobium sp. TaxID=391 RepID=UPI003899AB45
MPSHRLNATLAGKSAIVTGAASGIGRAIAVALSQEGCSLCLVDRAPLDKITAVVDAIAAAGGSALAVQADVADEGQVISAVANAASQLGNIDIVVNNAGILIEKPLLETTAGDFDAVIAVNLKGSFLVGREALRHMVKQRSGRVINIASELAYLGRANTSIYCASKGGIISMTRSWAREFAPDILVNAIAPGPTDTAMLEADSTPPETLAKETDIPLGRIAQPEEIAGAAVFLAGPGATFITGQCISPNGGAVMF